MIVRCSWCKRRFDINTEFRDKESRAEYKISGFCQKCQDKTFDGDVLSELEGD